MIKINYYIKKKVKYLHSFYLKCQNDNNSSIINGGIISDDLSKIIFTTDILDCDFKFLYSK